MILTNRNTYKMATIIEEYKKNQDEVEQLLKQIAKKIEKLNSSQNKHWGHVGSINKVKEDLKLISEFLGN